MDGKRLAKARWLWSPADGNPLDRWVVFEKKVALDPARDGAKRADEPAGGAYPVGAAAEAARVGASGPAGAETDAAPDATSLWLTLATEGRYQLWVNGSWLGEGPARSWPDELFYDSYDLSGFTGTGTLEVRVLIRHSVPGTTNHMTGIPGFAAELLRGSPADGTLLAATDGTWRCADHPAYGDPTVKMSNGLGYGEVARFDLAADPERWAWSPAKDCGPALDGARAVNPRDIPPLAETILRPAGIVGERTVRPVGFVRSVNLRPLVYPGEADVNKHKRFSGVLETVIRCPSEADAEIGVTFDPHDTEPLAFFVGEQRLVHGNGARFPVNLPAGDTSVRLLVRGEYHDPVFHLHLVLPAGASLVSPLGEDRETPFAFTGPFTKTAHLQVTDPIPPAASEVPSEAELLELFSKAEAGSAGNHANAPGSEGAVIPDSTLSGGAGAAVPVPARCVSAHHVALESLRAEPLAIPDGAFYLAGAATPRAFPLRLDGVPAGDRDSAGNPAGRGDPGAASGNLAAGTARQILWDFGREVSGFIEFGVRAPLGTRLDFFCFESMHDGFVEHAWSLNNGFRYYCAEGDNAYVSFQRRGFRYALMTVAGDSLPSRGRQTPDGAASPARDGGAADGHAPGGQRAAGSEGYPVELLSLAVRERLYPTELAGSFSCSDETLNRVREIAARTVALCMEDTYVDCPAYEQTYWTGDTRNSALYSYYLFGAYPLFLRSARLAARSLERSPLFESTVPSAWQNVIPAWSFFHVLAGTEYRYYSGDSVGFRALYPSLLKNMENAAAMRISLGGEKAFALHAWNMLDWAPMDVRDDSVTAHQNAEFALACAALARAARAEGFHADAERLESWAAETARAVEALFWSPADGAYRDSVARDGTPSQTFSVQTQMMACLAGIPDAAREEKLKALVLDPPASFVRIGSPFVRHFLHELLVRWGREDLLLEETKRIWGAMLEKGATTCWEGWLFIPGHYTRSHCHAWSAAPAYFLPSVVLGIRPEAPGFSRVLVRPWPGDLTRAEGTVPTPLGPLSVAWKIDEGRLDLSVAKPERMEVRVELPAGLKAGEITIN